ncbi:MAG: hypothetical protein ACI8RD_007929 [Bacillariaceae sp.]|jgi:hypothetical protein
MNSLDLPPSIFSIPFSLSLSPLFTYYKQTTWFYMAILQAVIFMIFQVQVMALYAYFPEVVRTA